MEVNQELYNLLRDGKSAEEITKMLNEAQAKLDSDLAEERRVEAESKAREDAIDEARADLQGAIEWYLIALGIAPDEDDEDSWDILSSSIEKAIVSVENTLRNTKVEIKTGKDAEDAYTKYNEAVKKYNKFYNDLFKHWF